MSIKDEGTRLKIEFRKECWLDPGQVAATARRAKATLSNRPIVDGGAAIDTVHRIGGISHAIPPARLARIARYGFIPMAGAHRKS
jgi:hypothetical protein